ncbi:MAG: PTS fructose transporter subunit IIA [Betaproteobacteria bacterium]|nr:PTS fructose transporter subunit IIA [Betaproteobacteria bacterium]
MVGILIIAHGTFGEALIHCCTHVLGERPAHVGHLSVAVGDDPDAVLPRARAALEALDSGEGVLVVTDVLGATPSNIATRLLEPGRIEGVSGASLPMLIRALNYRDEPLATVVAKAISGGCEGVVHIGHGAGRS